MGWPQYVAIVWMVLFTVSGIYASMGVGRTHGERTVCVLMDLTRLVVTVLVLSAGGFW